MYTVCRAIGASLFALGIVAVCGLFEADSLIVTGPAALLALTRVWRAPPPQGGDDGRIGADPRDSAHCLPGGVVAPTRQCRGQPP